MIIRPATPDDLPWLHAQCQAFSDFFGSALPLYGDPDHVDTALRALMADHVVLVAERAGVLMGVIAGMFNAHLMNPAIMTLCELMFWVPPEHRGSRAFLRLLEVYVGIGKQHATWLTFTLETKSPLDARVLERYGFRQTERNFLLEVAA